jgi:eukaryotic-like serine/threonine-protein kinase
MERSENVVRPGEIIARRFEIEQQAGAGGMGTVFRARDLETGKLVAVKRLDIRGKSDRERFLREAAVLSELKHPGIVRYVAHGKTEAGDPFLAMEWLEGDTLQDRLQGGKLAVGDAVKLGLRVASALVEAHKRGIVHRDIKPPNLFLPDGDIERVKVLDFGVARLTGPESAGAHMTRTGALIGTPGYMAPEQARGDRELDARADVFALASVLFECLAGRPPFSGANVMAVLAKILLEEAPRVRELRRDVPRSLDDLLSTMLAKDPDARPKDASAVLERLSSLPIDEADTTPAEPVASDADDGEAPTKPPSLTTYEQRVICVVLAGESQGTADTWSPGQAHSRDQELVKTVASYDARLDSLIDGTLVITLAASEAPTDLAARAARCAIAVKKLLLDVPIVLATGRGVVSARMPIGEVIDRAARTLVKAGTEFVQLDRPSANLLDGAGFDVGSDEHGSFLRGEVESIGTRRTLLGKPTPCVGRDRELVTLDALFTECVEEPVARAVLILGPVGIGKSRVRYEFLQRVKSRAEDVEILTARGDSLRAGAPFSMLAEAITRFADIADGEPLETRRAKLKARIGRHLSKEDALRATVFLGELAGIPFPTDEHEGFKAAKHDAMLMGDGMRAAFEDWLHAECGQDPVILVLEDLQWGDLPSIRFVDAALRNLHDSPFFVLAVARPEVHDQFPGLWADREVQEVRLGGLTKKAAEKLVAHALGPAISEERSRQLIERADGNPFYLEELVRAVAASPGGADDALPETILGMVQSRLDRLGTEAKRVLRAASVFGGTFWRGGIVALLGGGESTSRVTEWLDEVVDREIVVARPTSRFPKEVEYVFRQTLVREAAYATLTDHDAKLGHRLAATWLEMAGERDAVVVAEHYDRGGEPRKAIAYYQRGAEQALEGNDFKGAIRRAEAAIEAGAAGEVRGALHQIRGEAHVWLGEPAEAERHLEQAVALLPQGTIAWYRAVADVVACICRQGHRDRLPAWIERASTAVSPGAAISAQVSCLARTAENALLIGAYPDADLLLGQIDSITRRAADLDPLAVARVHRFRARRALHAGDPGAYVLGLTAAYQAFEGAGDMRNATNERMNLGFAYSEIGEYRAAEEVLRMAHASAKRMGLSHVMAWADNNLGNVLAHLVKWDEARTVEARAIEAGRAQKDPRLEGNSRIYMSAIALGSNDPVSAESEAARAAAMLEAVPALKTVALAARARALVALGKPEEALGAAKASMALLEELGGVEEGESLVRLAHAEALDAAGAREAAKDAIARAAGRLRARADRITEAAWRTTFLAGEWSS